MSTIQTILAGREQVKGCAIGHLHVKIGMLIGFVTSRVDARMLEKIVLESTWR